MEALLVSVSGIVFKYLILRNEQCHFSNYISDFCLSPTVKYI